jgi:hypothetical protein
VASSRLYHWDVAGGGFPLADIAAEMLALGVPVAPAAECRCIHDRSVGHAVESSGLREVRTCQIAVQRTFESFDDYWRSAEPSKSLRPMFEAMDAEGREQLKSQRPTPPARRRGRAESERARQRGMRDKAVNRPGPDVVG